MFNDKKYYEVNREERHFGFMLASELLNNSAFRAKVFEAINLKFSSNLNPDEFQIYTEVAALRDYWNDLGCSKEYSNETHTKRYEVLKSILNKKNYGHLDIDNNDVFWTSSNKQSRKLWCPAKWDENKLTPLEKIENDLKKIRWSFNAKPDIMIESPGSVVLLELKLESSEGKNKKGYNQFEIQGIIADLMEASIPCYKQATFKNKILSLKNDEKSLSWEEIISLLKESKRENIGYDNVLLAFTNLLNNYYKESFA